MCPISNEPAKYRDPITGQPFANKEAFKILREIVEIHSKLLYERFDGIFLIV